MIGIELQGLLTVRNVIVCLSLALLACGVWKRSQDRGELEFVREQVRRAAATTARPDLPPEAQMRLAQRHREALLAITDKERVLQGSDANGSAAKALRERIAGDVGKIPGTEEVNATDTAWYQFEAEREHDVRVALVVDWVFIVAGLLGLAAAGTRWVRDVRGVQRNPPSA